MAFTLLLSLLVALPSFGIDMSLPALTATGAALGVAPAQAGMMMSLFKAAGAPGNSTTGIPLTVRPRPVVSPDEGHAMDREFTRVGKRSCRVIIGSPPS